MSKIVVLDRFLSQTAHTHLTAFPSRASLNSSRLAVNKFTFQSFLSSHLTVVPEVLYPQFLLNRRVAQTGLTEIIKPVAKDLKMCIVGYRSTNIIKKLSKPVLFIAAYCKLRQPVRLCTLIPLMQPCWLPSHEMTELSKKFVLELLLSLFSPCAHLSTCTELYKSFTCSTDDVPGIKPTPLSLGSRLFALD